MQVIASLMLCLQCNVFYVQMQLFQVSWTFEFVVCIIEDINNLFLLCAYFLVHSNLTALSLKLKI